METWRYLECMLSLHRPLLIRTFHSNNPQNITVSPSKSGDAMVHTGVGGYRMGWVISMYTYQYKIWAPGSNFFPFFLLLYAAS